MDGEGARDEESAVDVPVWRSLGGCFWVRREETLVAWKRRAGRAAREAVGVACVALVRRVEDEGEVEVASGVALIYVTGAGVDR